MYGIEIEPYNPTERDLEFAQNLVRALKDNGMWGIPRSQLYYKKVGPKKMKLENYLIPALAKHLIKAGMYYEGMQKFESVDEFKAAQAADHSAFKACCEKLGIEVDDSVLDEQNDR